MGTGYKETRFYRSSEGHPNQGDLFNEAEQETAADTDEDKGKDIITYALSKPKRQPLPTDLPREKVMHDQPEKDKVCDCCCGKLHRMGEARSEKLEFLPAQIKVIAHVRPKYSCRTCERDGTEVQIKQTPLSPLLKGIALQSARSDHHQ